METNCLGNSIKMLVESMPNTHSITVGLYIRGGTRYENPLNNGICHLLEHIHFRELKNTSQRELYYQTESIGSTLRASTYYDFIHFSMKVRPCYLKNCIDIFEKILSTFSWSEDSFMQEKEVVINQILEKDYYNTQNCVTRNAVFGNSSLSFPIMGDENIVDGISLDELIDYKKHLFNGNNIVLCVTGAFENDDLEYIKNKIGTVELPDGKELVLDKDKKFLKRNYPIVVFDADSDNYLDVRISFNIDYNSVNINDLKILNCILGEGVGSRLQQSIREELHYTSDICSEIEAYEDFAVIHIDFSVQKSRFSDCFISVLNVVSSMKTDINSKDLDVTLPFYTENNSFLLDDTEQMNFEIGYNSFILKHNKRTYMKNNAESIQILSRTAEKVFTPENASVVIFGNCKGITKKSVKENIKKYLNID